MTVYAFVIFLHINYYEKYRLLIKINSTSCKISERRILCILRSTLYVCDWGCSATAPSRNIIREKPINYRHAVLHKQIDPFYASLMLICFIPAVNLKALSALVSLFHRQATHYSTDSPTNQIQRTRNPNNVFTGFVYVSGGDLNL